MNLFNAEEGKDYVVTSVLSEDSELDSFLFSLGCYSGETVTVVSRNKYGCVVVFKDGRYSIDKQLAEAIII